MIPTVHYMAQLSRYSRGRKVNETKRALLIGFYCTIGDTDSLQIVVSWLEAAGFDYTVAPFGGPVLDAIPGSILPEHAVPAEYSHVIVICGPCDRSYYSFRQPINPERFRHCHFIGVNLSMTEPVASWNPFDTLLERNSERVVRPDLTLLMKRPLAPVFGLCHAPDQPEYGERQRHRLAEQMLRQASAGHDAAIVPIDTGWPSAMNAVGLKSEAQVESLIGRMDVLLTTRLHGMVYALKNGVPALVVDPVAGGDKVIAQARAIGWPHAYLIDEATPALLSAGLEFCLTEKARSLALDCASRAKIVLSDVQPAFMAALGRGPGGAASRWPAVRKKARRGILTRAGGMSRRLLRASGEFLLRLSE